MNANTTDTTPPEDTPDPFTAKHVTPTVGALTLAVIELRAFARGQLLENSQLWLNLARITLEVKKHVENNHGGGSADSLKKIAEVLADIHGESRRNAAAAERQADTLERQADTLEEIREANSDGFATDARAKLYAAGKLSNAAQVAALAEGLGMNPGETL